MSGRRRTMSNNSSWGKKSRASPCRLGWRSPTRGFSETTWHLVQAWLEPPLEHPSVVHSFVPHNTTNIHLFTCSPVFKVLYNRNVKHPNLVAFWARVLKVFPNGLASPTLDPTKVLAIGIVAGHGFPQSRPRHRTLPQWVRHVARIRTHQVATTSTRHGTCHRTTDTRCSNGGEHCPLATTGYAGVTRPASHTPYGKLYVDE